ncbi:hemerythrin [Streptomyces viridiviolaceus]|uniref:Hemerythrin domain-containing protein n=1 Tax=Streptomyces viridiviolaceus TaxID=68282 RepID=A0ABW2E737_9ACTN|nr:hemerythrin domain-containing protein [Streptomyces viridiviolaceus]GHB54556.1 hemerythrin [Streptomyces viridiviolaceus]
MHGHRTIADQTLDQLGGESSVLARQRRDHVQLERLMAQYQDLGDGEDRERILKETVQLVFSHAFAEETVLWPAVRRCVPGGDELTARVEEEHQQINDLVTDIERLAPGDPEREQRVQQAFTLIRQDIRDEEDLLLPRLQDAVDTADLRRLGRSWELVRKTAPTHPHPVVPRRPPGNAVLGVPLSLYDRIRDALGFAASAPSLIKKLFGGLAGLLLSAAAAVTTVRKRR